jgi:hypothetical protein
MFRKSAKHHEFIRRILKKKVKKEKKLLISKILRSNKRKKITMKKENDVRNRVMKEIFQKNVQKKKKKFEKKKKRSRFIFDKEKDKIIKMIKKMKVIKKSLRCLRAKESRISFASSTSEKRINEKEFLIKLKNAQVIFSLIEIIIFIFFAQKIFFKILFDEDVIKFHVNLIKF